jgi:hypothetical protein
MSSQLGCISSDMAWLASSCKGNFSLEKHYYVHGQLCAAKLFPCLVTHIAGKRSSCGASADSANEANLPSCASLPRNSQRFPCKRGGDLLFLPSSYGKVCALDGI